VHNIDPGGGALAEPQVREDEFTDLRHRAHLHRATYAENKGMSRRIQPGSDRNRTGAIHIPAPRQPERGNDRAELTSRGYGLQSNSDSGGQPAHGWITENAAGPGPEAEPSRVA
jgi:hypothetical protein